MPCLNAVNHPFKVERDFATFIATKLSLLTEADCSKVIALF